MLEIRQRNEWLMDGQACAVSQSDACISVKNTKEIKRQNVPTVSAEYEKVICLLSTFKDI